jgi:glycosyltransferase involved in cell wall biosynthesis
MPQENPLISIVMPVYNSDDYLAGSIESILQQTFRNFEFIIICDDPTENTKKIIDSFRQWDDRLQVIYQKREGLVAALNKGCSLARGKYIARMDADDISLEERLKIQVDYMEGHPDIGLCGSAVRTFGEFETTIKFPVADSVIKATLLFYNPFAHPTVIMRKEIMDSYDLQYNDEFTFIEDYELWVQFSKISRFSNIDKVLLKYRIHPDKVSTKSRPQQQKNACSVFAEQLEALDIPMDEKKLSLHLSLHSMDLSLHSPEFRHDQEFLLTINAWLVELIEANKRKNVYDNVALVKVIAQIWTSHCIIGTKIGIRSWNLFYHSRLSDYISLTKMQKIKYLTACMVNIEYLMKMKRLLRV